MKPVTSPLNRRSLVAAIGLLCLSALPAGAQTLLFHYTFNETGTSAANAAGGAALGMFDAGANATDLHGAAGSGVSGQAGDRAFNPGPQVEAMGSLNNATDVYGQATLGSALALTSFTITGWYKAETAPGGSARLFVTNNSNVNLFFSGSNLQLNVDNVGVSSNNVNYQAVGSWVFFAVSYDSTLGTSNTRFYVGSTSGAATSVSTQTLNQGAPDGTISSIYLANLGNRDRPFDGAMDDFRLYSGVLTPTAIETVRQEGINNVPEPGAFVLSLLALSAVGLRRRQRAPGLQIRTPQSTIRNERGFTLVELLVVIAIIALLMAIGFPVFSRMRESARSAQNLSQLRQIHAALRSYAAENANCLPPVAVGAEVWDRDYLKTWLPLREDGRQNRVFIGANAKFKGVANADISRAYTATECMMGIDPATGNVAFTFGFPRNLATIADPAGAPLVFDGKQSGGLRYSAKIVKWVQLDGAADLKPPGVPTYIDFRNQAKAHFLYVDGHVGALTQQEAAAQFTRNLWQGI
jgi:prepilin-type N-terminal cleavage/methylation domain-containing protein/prepilin-type processing-associated H-X9-DG protein